MPFSTPAHKQLDPAKQAGQVFPAQAESEAKAAIAAAANEPAHSVRPPFPYYVDIVVREIVLTIGEAAGAVREVIERTWFADYDAATRFQKWAAKRGQSPSPVTCP